ncbi:MAG TPA: hypothetical protein DCR39_08385 [Nitrospiraceae bacterium]|nr:hypothetical protein [Nitrospiraceae bacterium]
MISVNIMKFIADEMLGRLAKWLRIFGYDTLYIQNIRDAEIIRRSIIERRILLTRDTIMIKRKGLKNFLFISHDHTIDQLKQVVYELRLSQPDNPFSRCVVCNTAITTYSKEYACRTVPEYVCNTQDVFGYCQECKKIYWKGTHYAKMLKTIEGLFIR